MSALPDAVRRVVTTLSDAHIAALASTLRPASGCTPETFAAACRVLPSVHYDEIYDLYQAWTTEPTLAGAAIALALEASRSTILLSDTPSVEVVVTGPDSSAVPIRLTSEVVVNLIGEATSRVTIVSYSVASIPAVREALAAAKAQGVKVVLIFESPDQFGGGGGGAHHYSEHATYHWPADKRPAHARLHAKAVIVDGRNILVTSANLSNLAYQDSLELGLLCRGGGVADRVQRHFDALIASDVLVVAAP